MALNLGRIMRLLIGAGKPRYAALLAARAVVAFWGFYGLWQGLLIDFNDFTCRPNDSLKSNREFSLAPN